MLGAITCLTAHEQAFVQTHLTTDVRNLLLNPPVDKELDIKRVAGQLAARQKARTKLPTWYAQADLIFPPTLSVEQASSERAAQYKAELTSGQRLLDLTGGMGVDTWAFAQYMAQVQYVDRNPELADLAAHNLPLLGATNVQVLAQDGLLFLTAQPNRADWIYLDPARRNEQGGKVVNLADCEPDLSQPGTLALLLGKAHQVLLKTSPLIDIEQALRQLPTARAVHVVAVQGEVKEVLFVLGQTPIAPIEVQTTAVNLTITTDSVFTFRRGDERLAEVTFGEPLRMVYEPNAALLKAGAFRLVAEQFGLQKLAPNSHLYTASNLVAGFPGRTFTLLTTCKPDRRALRTLLPDGQANLTVRNFPQTVAELRKRLDLREGGNYYIFATTLLNGDKQLLLCQKI